MSVYVDQEKNSFGRMKMCHMVADSLDELHEMAGKLGLKRSWFQGKKLPHYDVSMSKRAQAIELGAISIDRKQLYAQFLKPRRQKLELYKKMRMHPEIAEIVDNIDDGFVLTGLDSKSLELFQSAFDGQLSDTTKQVINRMQSTFLKYGSYPICTRLKTECHHHSCLLIHDFNCDKEDFKCATINSEEAQS